MIRSPQVVPFTERTLKHWMPRQVVESSSLEVFQRHVDLAFREVINGGFSVRFTVGFNDMKGLFLPQ